MSRFDASPSAPRIADCLGLIGATHAIASAGEGSATDRTFRAVSFLEIGSDHADNRGRLVLAPGLDSAAPGFFDQMQNLHAEDVAGVIIKGSVLDSPNLPPELSELLYFLDENADWADTAQMLRALSVRHANPLASGIRQGDLFALANTLASLAGGAVSLVDSAGRVVGYSTHPDQLIDSIRRRTTLALQERQHPNLDSEYQALARSSEALFFPGSSTRYGRVAMPLRAAGELLGTVWVIQIDPDSASDTQHFLSTVEALVAYHMAHARDIEQASERRSSDLIRALVQDSAHRHSAALQLGLNLSRMHTVVSFRPLDSRTSNPILSAQQLLHQVSTTARGQFTWSHSAVLDGMILTLVGDSDPAQSRLFADRITQIANGAVVAGIGRPAATVTLIPRSYRDAVSISRHLVAKHERFGNEDTADSAGIVAGFSEVSGELGLMRLGGMLQETEVIDDDDMTRILEYDQAHQSHLAETLLTFFNQHSSVRRAAEMLHVHQNTIRYRLETLRTELDIDLDDSATRLWIWLRLVSLERLGRTVYRP